MQWLLSSQDPRTGLLRSYDTPGDTTSWSYDQPIGGIIALLSAGHVDAARRCADTMLDKRMRSGKPPAWADGYDTRTRKVKYSPLGRPYIQRRMVICAKARAAGPNAWIGLAMLKLHLVTGERKYLAAAKDAGAFLLSLLVREGRLAGGIRGGFDENGKPFRWIATEHNADAIALLGALSDVTGEAKYRQAAIRIVRFLNGVVWDPAQQCYLPGYDLDRDRPSDFPERLDSQTWTLLADYAVRELPSWPTDAPRLRNGLAWIDQHLKTIRTGGRSLVGFGKITLGGEETQSTWSEGALGYLMATNATGHAQPRLAMIAKAMGDMQLDNGAVAYSMGTGLADVAAQFSLGDIVVAHFEAHPNSLYGQVGIYGDGEPNWEAILAVGRAKSYSWYYEFGMPGYAEHKASRVHSGRQSFCLVHGTVMCRAKKEGWASLSLDLGPNIEGQIRPLDVSNYGQLSFWSTSKDLAGRISVLFRDAHSRDYMPQAEVRPAPAGRAGLWIRYVVPLRRVARKVDLRRLVHVGLGYGRKAGNPAASPIYVDDFAFTGRRGGTGGIGSKWVPRTYPANWPFGSVAGTSWTVFWRKGINPFALRQGLPPTKKR